MKWLFYVLVALYMIFRAVYGEPKETISITKDMEVDFWSTGEKHEILCSSTQKNQKLRWKDPNGRDVERRRAGNTRVYSQERPARGVMPVLALIFARTIPNDTGLWTCTSGEQIKFTPVCVMELADFVTTPTEVTADVGRAITLTCEARGQPEPIIRWHRDDNVITDDSDSSKYKLMTKFNVDGYEGLLTITSLEPSDSSIYVCEARQENDLCVANQTINITLNVNHAPTIVPDSSMVNLYVNYDDNATLACEAESYPKATYSWYQQFPDRDRKLESDTEWSIVTDGFRSVLQFLVDNETAHDSFMCRASNKYGDAEKIFKLFPLIPPAAPSGVVLVNETDTAFIFHVIWSGLDDDELFPLLGFKVQYMKKSKLPNGRPWRESDWNRAKTYEADKYSLDGDLKGAEFKLDNLSPDTTYWIRLRIYNEAGYSDWSKAVTYSTLPFVPKISEIENETESSTKDIITETTTDINLNDIPNEPLELESNNFYAVVFGISIFVLIGGSTFLMKKL